VYQKIKNEIRSDFSLQADKIICGFSDDIEGILIEKQSELKKFLDDRVTHFGLSFLKVIDHGSNKTWEAENLHSHTTSNQSASNAKNTYSSFCEIPGFPDFELTGGISYENLASLENSIVKNIYVTIFGQIVLLLAVTFYLAYFIQYRTAPILSVCNRISNGDLEARVPIEGRDELTQIAESINLMASGLLLHNQTAHSQSKLVALGEMAGGIAHEINNPLAIISSRATLLKTLAQKAPPEFAEKLALEADKIDNVVQRIAKIVKGLLNFARNQNSAPLATTTVQALIDETLTLCLEKFTSHHVKLHLEIPKDLVVSVRQTEMTQVLLNLLNNSFYAIKDLQDKWIKVSAQKNSEKIEILVSDSGPGIPPEIAEKIMQPFYTTKPVGEGTGLGLSISLGIIQSFQGRLELLKDTQNTTFKITLPVSTEVVSKNTAAA
jgi:C4-dicarboxylate-specific signal transduction histidine kinase